MIIDDITIYPNILEELIDQFKIDNNIEDISSIPHNTFNYLMTYIYNNTFKINKCVLYTESRKNNEYDIKKIEYLLNIYIELCDRFNKVPSIMGFCRLTGINKDTLNTWRREYSTCKGDVVTEKIKSLRLDSLVGRLADGKHNPVGMIAILNNEYNWATSNTKAESVQLSRLTANNLPNLSLSDTHCINDD